MTAPQTPSTRRLRREREMRARILDAAIACFLEQGFEATTIDEIAERADVARATVFNHFGEKKDLLSAYLNRRREELVDLLRREARADVSARRQLYDALDLIATFNERNVAETRVLIGAWWRSGGTTAREPYTAFVLADLIEAGQRSGEFRPDIDPLLIGSFILDAYAGLLLRWVATAEEQPFSLRDTLRRICDVVLDGIATNQRSQPSGPNRRS